MFSTCSELTPRAPIPDGRMERFMHPWFQHMSLLGNGVRNEIKDDSSFCKWNSGQNHNSMQQKIFIRKQCFSKKDATQLFAKCNKTFWQKSNQTIFRTVLFYQTCSFWPFNLLVSFGQLFPHYVFWRKCWNAVFSRAQAQPSNTTLQTIGYNYCSTYWILLITSVPLFKQ